ncbi:MAG: AAA family ATPase [Thiobacillus sp.]|uniref:ATP-binding protein n=1 Tax=Thiobacillus sp. TaxID=924 RepID=UPI00289449E8|nr:AAA family ATPase [Thiobacillus sp.]MDT3706306.1 AAA family ATPase [Thiobacillus sp.]
MINLQVELKALEAMRRKLHLVFPAYITHIRFPRYKNMVAGARIDFKFPITALVGANGSGKTSVLNALYGAPKRCSTGEYWFSTKVDPIEEGEGSPNRFIYGHYNHGIKGVVETRKARVRKVRNGRENPNYWEPTKESPGDDMIMPAIAAGKKIDGRSLDRWNPVARKVVYINFRKELSAFDKYFYFGKDPVERSNSKAPKSRRILSKKDLIIRDAGYLAKILTLGDTSLALYGRKLATENRLLSKSELQAISYVLGRDYTEARLVRHRLFRGDGNLSVRFKTAFGQYSEAFAGSGEVAVTSCVIQVLASDIGSLLLLDEPEVSLHPGAQERLLAFLARNAKEKQLQVVFSTHSPHLIAALPDDAIKTFVQLKDGSFSVIPSTHPYAAFRHLGATNANEIVVLVEDRLAQAVIHQALLLIDDEALRKLFRIEYLPGGATALLISRIPVLMEGPSNVLILLDGDQYKGDFQHPDEIPAVKNGELDQVIFEAIGTTPRWLIDGDGGDGNAVQKIATQRRYLLWIYENLKYLPSSSPEEIVLKAADQLEAEDIGKSQKCKERLKAMTQKSMGGDLTSEDIDKYGAFLLGQHRDASPELGQLVITLKEFAGRVRPA